MTRRIVLRARAGRRSSPWLRQGRALVTCVDHRPVGDADETVKIAEAAAFTWHASRIRGRKSYAVFSAFFQETLHSHHSWDGTRQGKTSQQYFRSTLLFVARVMLLVINLVGVSK